jgi:tetratricopeptide (TPR) repeat protein
MTTRQHFMSNELNKTQDTTGFVEKFHAAECYGMLVQVGLLSEDKVTSLLDQVKVSERRNKMLEALMKITFAKIAGREGNYQYADELFSQVLAKINVLNKGTQQESALSYFYYEYAEYLELSGDLTGSALYLEKARNSVRSNKLKQMIVFKRMVREDESLKKSALRKWLQSIAYFNNYEMTVMETEAHFEIARKYIALGELTEATNHLDQAHELAATSGYQYLRWNIDLTKGHLLKGQDREPELIIYYETLLKTVESSYFKTLLLSELSSLYHNAGKYDKAIELATASMEISQRFAIKSELATSSALLGELYHRHASDITKAYFYFQQAYGAVIELVKSKVPVTGEREKVLQKYVIFLEEHFPGDLGEAANEDLFAFSTDLDWVKIKDLFHYNLFLYHYMNSGVGNKTLEALDFPASSFYSATERLRTRGIPFPNFRKSNVDIPAENYIEGLQQYSRLHREKTWVEINDRFEKDMLAYHYKLNNYNKKLLAKNLGLAYSGIVNRTRYLTSSDN